ncbi:MAG TPA: hypothetical protein VE170_16945, partial [Candidatus Limnocylindria bacterium]|nr:hypothetical protein [Candidatus Limnocylindria bacterium]
TGVALLTMSLGIAACSTQDEMVAKPAAKPAAPAPAATAKTEAKAEAKGDAKAPAKDEAKSEAKAAATKLAGDVGLLDTEKNYLIVVTKEGKLVTVDYDAKFQPTQRELKEAKVADIGLGSAATVLYTKDGDKNIASSIEFLPAKGE